MGFRFFRSTVFFTGENIPVHFRRVIIETLDQKREVTLWLERKEVPGHFLCEWATNKGGIANDGSKSSSKVGCLEEAFFLSTSYRWSSRNTTSFCWSETRVEQGLPPGKVRPWSLRKKLVAIFCDELAILAEVESRVHVNPRLFVDHNQRKKIWWRCSPFEEIVWQKLQDYFYISLTRNTHWRT